MGHFLKKWCEYWKTWGMLHSRNARADLESILILLQSDMAEIESIHASIRRELYVLSTQTSSVQFLELSDRHVLRCARRHPVSYGVAKHNDVGIDRALATSSSDDAPTAPNAEPQAAKRQTSAYRHWLSEHTGGNPRGCCQRGLHQVFTSLPESERMRHEAAASNVKEAATLGHRGYQPTRRIIAIAAKKRSAAEKLKQSGVAALSTLRYLQLCSHSTQCACAKQLTLLAGLLR